jgi:hypothetical protein
MTIDPSVAKILVAELVVVVAQQRRKRRIEIRLVIAAPRQMVDAAAWRATDHTWGAHKSVA